MQLELDYFLSQSHHNDTQGHSLRVCTGEWSHWSRVTKFPTRRWLSDVSINARTGQPTVFNRRTAGTTATSAIVSDTSAHGTCSTHGVAYRSYEDIVGDFTFDPEAECEPDLNKNDSSTTMHPLARILESAREYVALWLVLHACKPVSCVSRVPVFSCQVFIWMVFRARGQVPGREQHPPPAQTNKPQRYSSPASR